VQISGTVDMVVMTTRLLTDTQGSLDRIRIKGIHDTWNASEFCEFRTVAKFLWSQITGVEAADQGHRPTTGSSPSVDGDDSSVTDVSWQIRRLGRRSSSSVRTSHLNGVFIDGVTWRDARRSHHGNHDPRAGQSSIRNSAVGDRRREATNLHATSAALRLR
jgi:hypothetical protein